MIDAFGSFNEHSLSDRKCQI